MGDRGAHDPASETWWAQTVGERARGAEWDLLHPVDGLPKEGAAERSAAKEYSARLSGAVELGWYVRAHPPRALCRGARAGRTTRKPRRVRKKGGLARSFGLRRGQEDQRSQAAHPGRHVGSPVERCRSSRRRSRPRWSIPSVAPGTPTVPLHQAHLCRRWLCGRQDGARRVAHRDMEAGDCEATRCHRFRDLVQKMDRRKDIRLDQPQSSPSPRFRTLRHNSCRVRPLGHDPHHAKAACCRKLLVMNPNLPDGLSVPLIKDNEAIGAFNILRRRTGLFTEKQIELVSNFTRQAVIAIENTRLLNELHQ